MPFFRRGASPFVPSDSLSREDRAALEKERLSNVQQSQDSLAVGGLPIEATRRLASLKGSASSAFTSDLSVNEFNFIRRQEMQPISQVTGSSIYRVGYQNIPLGSSGVLESVTTAYNEARRLALGRLRQEATLCGADAVAGVRVKMGRFDYESDMVEFMVIGTAVSSPKFPLRTRNRDGNTSPALTSLSGQEFGQILDAGYSPCGVIGYSSVYLASLSAFTYQQMNSWYLGAGSNFEVAELTDGVYRNRHIVSSHLVAQAQALEAAGIIGVEWNHSSWKSGYAGQEQLTAVAFSTHALATAIRGPSHEASAVDTVPVVTMRP